MNLSKIVLWKFSKDNMIFPAETAWFGFYADRSYTKILKINETELYLKDFIGLKRLHQ